MAYIPLCVCACDKTYTYSIYDQSNPIIMVIDELNT